MAFLKFNKSELVNLSYSLKREIISANKTGAYVNTSIVTCNTRRYHGLLAVTLDRFGGDKFLLLSSLDESLVVNRKQFNLGIHCYGDIYEPRGHKYVVDFKADPVPQITYKVGQVVFTKDTHDERYLETQEGKYLPVPHCLVGTRGWELVDELDAFQREHDLPVYLKGTFGSTDLMHDLEAAYARGNVASVEFIGLCTDICVVSNAMLVKAALPQLPVLVDAACCAGVTPTAHEAALATMRSCQIQVH